MEFRIFVYWSPELVLQRGGFLKSVLEGWSVMMEISKYQLPLEDVGNAQCVLPPLYLLNKTTSSDWMGPKPEKTTFWGISVEN